MAVTEDLLVKINIDVGKVKDANEAMVKLFSELSTNVKSASMALEAQEKTNKSLGFSFIYLNQAIELATKAYDFLIDPVKESITEFLGAEKAVLVLTNTLQAMGFQTQEAFADLEEFAKQMQRVTVVEDDVILKMATLAKTYGLTNAATKDVIKTAIGMSNALGMDVSSALENLLGQLNGVVGRGLAKIIPGMKDLTEAQLKAGVGIEMAGKKFASFATVVSISGQLEQLKNATKEAFKAAGETIVNFIGLSDILKNKTEIYYSVAEAIRSVGEHLMVFKKLIQEISLKELTIAVIELAAAIGVLTLAMNASAVITWITAMAKMVFVAENLMALEIALNSLIPKLLLFTAKFVLITASVLGLVLAIDTLVANLDRLPLLTDTIWIGLKNLFERAIKGFSQIGIAALSAFESILEPLNKIGVVSDDGLNLIRTGLVSLANTVDSADESINKLNKDFVESAKGLNMGAILSTIVKTVDAVKGAFKDTTKEVHETKKAFNDLSKVAIPGPSKEQLTLLAQIRLENEQIANESKAVGMSQIDSLRNQFEIIQKQIESRKEQLQIEGKLAGSAGVEIINALNKQLDLQKQLMEQKVNQVQLETLKQIQVETKNMANNSLMYGMAQEDQIAAQRDILLEQLVIRKQQLEAEGKLAGETGQAIIDQLETQMKIQTDLAEKKIFDVQLKSTGEQGEAWGQASMAFLTNFTKVSESSAQNFSLGVAKVVPGIVNALGTFTSAIGKMFDPEFIQGLADSLSNLVSKFPDLLMKAFNSLADAIGKIIESLPTVISKLFDSLGSIFDKIISMFPQMIDSLSDALVTFLDRLPELVGKSFSALSGIIDKLLSRLPDIIDALFRAIPAIIIQSIQAVPGMIVAILNRLPDILESIIFGIIGAMGEIVAASIDFWIGGGLEKIVVAFIKGIPRIAMALVNGVVRGLVRALGAIFKGIKAPAFIDSIADLPKKLGKGIAELGKSVAKESSKVFKILDLESEANAVSRMKNAGDVVNVIDIAAEAVGKKIRGVWDQMLSALTKLWDWLINLLTNVWNGLVNFFSGIWNGLVNIFKAAWGLVNDLYIKPMTQIITAAWKFVYETFIKPIPELLTAAWSLINDLYIKPMTQIIQAAWEYVNTYIIQPFIGILKTAWDGLKDFFTNIFKGKIDEAFKGLFETFGKLGTQIWDQLKGAVEGAGNLFGKFGTQIWDSLKSGLSGLGKVIKDALDLINPSSIFTKIFKIDPSETDPKMGGTVEKTLGINLPFVQFAKGGVLNGNALVAGDSFLNDRILAMLSPGEAIIPRSLMSNPTVKSLIDMILSGQLDIPKFKSGIGSITDVAKTAGGNISDTAKNVVGAIEEGLSYLDPSKLWDIVKEKTFGIIMKIFEANKFHSGGLVAGGGEVPALLQSGEFVVDRNSVKSFLNNPTPGNTNYSFNIEMNIEASSQSLDETYIRNKLIPSIKDEMKKASLRGEFLISTRGLRT